MDNLNKYDLLHTELMKRLEEGEITTEQAKYLNNKFFDKYIIEDEIDIYNEGFKDSVKEKTDKVVSVAKEKMVPVSKKIVKGIDDASTKVSKKLFENKINKASNEKILAKYEKASIIVKSAIKGVLTLAAIWVCPRPFDLILDAVVIANMASSDDPADKFLYESFLKLKEKCKDLKDKVKSLMNDFKNKKITDDEFRSRYDTLLLQGKNCAKELDVLNAKQNKDSTVKESTELDMEIFHNHIFKEDGSFVDNIHSVLSYIIENVDYEKYDVYDTINDYIEMLY